MQELLVNPGNNPVLLGGIVFVVVVAAILVLYWVNKLRSQAELPKPEVDPNVEAQAKARLSAITGIAVNPQSNAEGSQSLTTSPGAMPPAFQEEAPLSLSSSSPPSLPGNSSVLTQYASGDGQGVEEMEKMLEKDPDNLQLLDWLAFLYYSNNQTDKAIETYTRIISIDPSNPTQHYYLANSYYKANRIQEALTHWRTVVSLKPDGKISRKANEKIERVGAAAGA